MRMCREINRVYAVIESEEYIRVYGSLNHKINLKGGEKQKWRQYKNYKQNTTE
jgi:hypothetical protein